MLTLFQRLWTLYYYNSRSSTIVSKVDWFYIGTGGPRGFEYVYRHRILCKSLMQCIISVLSVCVGLRL